MNVQTESVTSPPTGHQQKCTFSVKTLSLVIWHLHLEQHGKGFSTAPVTPRPWFLPNRHVIEINTTTFKKQWIKSFIFSQCVHIELALYSILLFIWNYIFLYRVRLVFHLITKPSRPPVGRVWILQTRHQSCYLWRAIGSTTGHLPGKRAQLSAQRAIEPVPKRAASKNSIADRCEA